MEKSMGPLAWAGDKVQDILIWLFQFATDHPMVTGAVVGWWIFSYITVAVVRGLYPDSRFDKDERPPVARILLLLCEPFVGTAKAVITFLFNKIGIKLSVSVGNTTPAESK